MAANRTLALIGAGLCSGAVLCAHNVISTSLTWTGEISRIIYRRCASCHRAGGAAPMSLLTYAEARPWAKAIKEEVLERRMPPWGAVKGFGDLRDDMALTAEELHTIADWVEGGAPEGDPAYLPAPPSPVPASSRMPAAGVVTTQTLRLAEATRITWVRPGNMSKGASLRAVAELPGGAVEPLLWIYNFDPRWRRTYYYRNAIALPAGSVIRLSGKATLSLGTR